MIAALLGAEEFGFATAPLVTMGCMMMRVCNQDTCPFGIATQNEELRKRFKGKPEYVMNFMLFIAEEMREIMASLGFRTVEEMVGRSDCLKTMEHQITKRAEMVDLSYIIDPTYSGAEKRHFDKKSVYDFKLEKTVDEKTLLPAFATYIKSGKPHSEEIKVSSTDRTVGTILGSEISAASAIFTQFGTKGRFSCFKI